MDMSTRTPDVLSARERVEGRLARVLSGLPGSWLLTMIGERPVQVDGLTLDPHLQFILAARRRHPQRLLSGPTPVDGRRRMRREIESVTTGSGVRPTRVKTVRAITVDGAEGPLDARHYVPLMAPGSPPPPVVLFLHGGGFVIGDLDTHDEPCRLLCHHAGAHVVSVDYRLAPEHPFPAPLDDAIAALRWLQREAANLGADPAQVCVGGDSAGANLATVAAFTLAREGTPPAAQYLVYPTTDMQSSLPSRTVHFVRGYVLSSADMDAFRDFYLQSQPIDPRDHRTSPLYTPDPAIAPPAVIVTAGFDPLRDEGRLYAEALQQAGVDVRFRQFSSLIHGFLHMTTVVPAARAAAVESAQMLAFLLRSPLRVTAAQRA
jgi:acetyl esterase